jgi:hypothetical protein
VRRDDEATEVVVVETLGAPRAGGRGRRRRRPARRAEPGSEAAPLPLTRATVIRPDDLGGPAEATRWLERISRDAEASEAQVGEAVVLLNRALHAHRAAAQDPYVHDVSAPGAVAIRIGYGTGDEVADGRWSEARELPLDERRTRRTEALQPQEGVAAVLGGREAVPAGETLVLRARLDLDQGRAREAALQLRVGLEALLRELGTGADARQAGDLESLERRRERITEAANQALRGEPDPGRVEEMEQTLAICERVLRRRWLRS